jgi:hypothetical protein
VAKPKQKVTFIRDTDPDPEDLPVTFVDRYSEWASTITDAPAQYHRATGVTILSTVMTPYISLPTSFGTFIPNIWIMILAGTTMTRKSTSLDIARRLLDDVTDDYMLATDGSPEGLLTELGYRDGKVSLFHRDEITGFISAISGRDYLSGLLESFTRLYDGQPETRILRRERIEITKPYLIFMAGGIKTRMEELVGMEHIRSGFLPRFIFVTGSTTREQVRPIGPPSDEELRIDGESPRDQVLNELWRINEYYSRDSSDDGGEQVIKIAGIVKAKTPTKKHVRLKGTPEFWDRLIGLNDDAMELGEKSSAPELYTPLYQRLANSILKVSMLLAGADLRDTIEVSDLQKAIVLAQEWVETVTGFATAIEQQPEMDKWEKKADKIVQWVKVQHPRPITQTEVMQKFRIRKRDIDDIEATLMLRGVIAITPWPHSKNAKGGSITYTVSDTPVHQALGRTPTKIEREDTYHAASARHEESARGYVADNPEPYTITVNGSAPASRIHVKRSGNERNAEEDV